MSSNFLALAISRRVVLDALRIACIVGTLLALINHGHKIISLSLSSEVISQILLTYLVPYCVSSYSTVKALQKNSST